MNKEIDLENVEEVEVVSVEDSVETTEEDNKPEEILEYANLRMEDDGFLGIPVFTKDELHILQMNLYVDMDTIQQQKQFMAGALIDINSPEEEKDAESIENIKNLYISARNVLVQIQKSLDEYMSFIAENREEILDVVKNDVNFAIERYANEVKEEFGIEYKDSTLVNYVTAVALSRLMKNINDDPVVKMLNLEYIDDYDVEFEKQLRNIIKPMLFLLSNGSRETDINTITKDENEFLKISSNILKKYKNDNIYKEAIKSSGSFGFDKIGSPKNIAMSFLFKLSKITNMRAILDFKKETVLHNRKAKRAKKENNPPVKLSDDLLKTRLTAIIFERYIKLWFSYSVFGDSKILNDKDTFLSVITEMNDKFTSDEVVIGLINTFSFRYIFDEFVNIIGNLSATGKKYDMKQIKLIKNYLVYVTFYRNSLKYEDYDISNIYNNYISAVSKAIKGK